MHKGATRKFGGNVLKSENLGTGSHDFDDFQGVRSN